MKKSKKANNIFIKLKDVCQEASYQERLENKQYFNMKNIQNAILKHIKIDT